MLRTAFVVKTVLAGLMLGLLIGQPAGATSEQTESVEALKEPASLGDAMAQYTIGLVYVKGKGVKQSNVEAPKLYCHAADRGEALVQSRQPN